MGCGRLRGDWRSFIERMAVLSRVRTTCGKLRLWFLCNLSVSKGKTGERSLNTAYILCQVDGEGQGVEKEMVGAVLSLVSSTDTCRGREPEAGCTRGDGGLWLSSGARGCGWKRVLQGVLAVCPVTMGSSFASSIPE